MATATVHAGICGFTTVVTAASEDGQDVEVGFRTDCPNYAPLDGTTHRLDAFEACFTKVGEGPVYELLRPHCVHAACPVPSAVTKVIEVAAGLALPRDVSIEITKD